jgi:hypothetical protein
MKPNNYSSRRIAAIEEVLQSLEDSLTVDLIAEYGVSMCEPTDIACEVFLRPENAFFDQIPVKSDHIIGVLERGAAESTGQVSNAMKPLHDSMIIASHTGLLTYIRFCIDPPYRLVVAGGGVEGIVTPSDLLKLPVRTLLFTLLTHLEATMADFIERRIPEARWSSILKPPRLSKLEQQFLGLKERNLDVTKLLATEWSDKRDLVMAELGRDDRIFEQDLRQLELLRNAVAHASIFEPNIAELSRLTHRAYFWIHQLDHLSEAGTPKLTDQGYPPPA